MKWEKFKNRFRKDIHQQDASADVDIDAIWNAIEPRVDELNQEKRKNRKFIFWLFFAGLLVAGSGLFFLFGKNEKGIISENKILEKSEASGAQKDILIQNVKVQKESSNQKITQVENLAKENEGISNTSIEQKSSNGLTNKSANNFSKTKINNKELKQYSTEQRTIPRLDNSKNNESGNQKNKDLTSNENIKPQNQITNIEKISSSILGVDADLILKHGNQSSHHVDKLESTQTENTLAFLPSIFSLLLIEEQELVFVKRTNENIFSEKINKEEGGEEGDGGGKKGESKFQFSASIFGGASYVNRSMSAKNISANELLNIRKAHETSLEGSHFGVLFGVRHKSGFGLSIGVQRTVFAERYDWVEKQVTIDSIDGVEFLRINLEGDSVPIMGMISETTITTNNKKIYNNYRLVGIPILIGYEKAFGKWKLGAEAGIVANISLKTSGIIPDELFNDIDIKQNQSSYFKSKIGMNYQLNLVGSYPVLKNLEIQLAPSFRFFPKDFTVNEYGISQKYTLLGGDIRLRYRF